MRVLESIERVPDNPWVVPGRVERRPMRSIDEAWGVVCELAALRDIRIHDCRHSFASRALALGVSRPMIGRRLGHSEVRTTERYAHLASDWLKESAVRISESIAADILTGYPGVTLDTELRGGPADEDEAIVTPLFPARLRGRSSRAA